MSVRLYFFTPCVIGTWLVSFCCMPYVNIIQDSTILGGKPVIKGTRISVEFLLELLASGMNSTQIVSEYPSLTEVLIREALAFAATELQRTEVEWLPV